MILNLRRNLKLLRRDRKVRKELQVVRNDYIYILISFLIKIRHIDDGKLFTHRKGGAKNCKGIEGKNYPGYSLRPDSYRDCITSRTLQL